jgi:hypothetical protein
MIRNMLEKFSYLETDESVENYYYPINHQLKLVVNENKKKLTVLTVSLFNKSGLIY